MRRSKRVVFDASSVEAAEAIRAALGRPEVRAFLEVSSVLLVRENVEGDAGRARSFAFVNDESDPGAGRVKITTYGTGKGRQHDVEAEGDVEVRL
jgi:hypothetical protein